MPLLLEIVRKSTGEVIHKYMPQCMSFAILKDGSEESLPHPSESSIIERLKQEGVFERYVCRALGYNKKTDQFCYVDEENPSEDVIGLSERMAHFNLCPFKGVVYAEVEDYEISPVGMN